ncbi:MAG TPA: NADPH:quinone reductase [Pirellulaceae bacterium]|nr:NADPH:quinone reductase [Pirellulaceae bacterium]
MIAAFIDHVGPPEVIRVDQLPQPSVGPHQVLVRTEYAAVNPIDCYLRSGMVAMPIPSPFIPGCDVAGTVVAMGSQVRGFQVGDRVWSTNQGLLGRQGTMAEFCVVDESMTFHIPPNVSARDAAACGLVGATAWLGLFAKGCLQPGEIVFVRGGTGGVGSMVVQMAKAHGARVIASAGTETKVQQCLKLGADFAVNYREADWPDLVQRFAPDGVNLFWDTTRQPDFELAVSLMAENARMILMAGREARPPFPVGPFYVKQLSLLGVVVFKSSTDELAQAALAINQWLARGLIRSPIAMELPLQEAASAHRIQEEFTVYGRGELQGKIVIRL